MWLSVLKLLAFASVVLFLGQMRVGSATIGEHYYRATGHLWNKAGEEIKKSSAYTKLAELTAAQRWLTNVYPPPAVKELIPTAPVVEDDGEDHPAATDRESILKLLD